MQFTDSIENNLEIIRELLLGVPPEARRRASKAAGQLENVFTKMQRDYPNDPAVALGAAFAIYTLAQRLVDAGKGGDATEKQGNLIHLLS